ncbi:hypothetical protein JW960_05940 [candidate division KSB1 bacterium]|nr:hypothetical protein [candidate division KSB1 bacterium]
MKQSTQDGPQRIKYIPYRESMHMEKNLGALLGALVFIGGILIIGRTPFAPINGRQDSWIFVSVAGLCWCALALILKNRKLRKNWIRVKARCLDREIWKGDTNDGDTGKTWYFILLCEFDLHGRTYKVTPGYWTTFATKGSVTRFLDKRITTGGLVEIYVNPDNPLQTELVGRDIKDLLLH